MQELHMRQGSVMGCLACRLNALQLKNRGSTDNVAASGAGSLLLTGTYACYAVLSVLKKQQSRAASCDSCPVCHAPAHLVIALACGAVAHCICANLLGNLNLALGNQRPAAYNCISQGT
jgi:hypothetical protein